ncbi:MAG: aminomethyltransferase beta-barrel domain-containing protein, partial [Chloroflexota bacterium]
IGQRKGLGISVGQPIYVLRKDVARNALVVGTRDELGRSELLARDVSWLSGTPPNDPVRAEVKIRYKARPATATVIPLPDGRARVRFDDHVFGATSGQGVTFYDGELCLGGGLIADSVTIGGRATEAVGAEKGQ